METIQVHKTGTYADAIKGQMDRMQRHDYEAATNACAWTDKLAITVFAHGTATLDVKVDSVTVGELRTSVADLLSCMKALFPKEFERKE